MLGGGMVGGAAFFFLPSLQHSQQTHMFTRKIGTEIVTGSRNVNMHKQHNKLNGKAKKTQDDEN